MLESILPVFNDQTSEPPPAPKPAADPVRFGPTTFAPPPAPIEFPPITDLADAGDAPDLFADPVATTDPLPVPATGEVKIKKSSSRKRGSKRDKANDKAQKETAAPPAAKTSRRPFSKKAAAPAAAPAEPAPAAERSIFDTSRPEEA